MHHLDNLILNTDSYKASHWLQYPPDTDATFFYVESRGGQYDNTVFFGLQAILKEYFSRPITHADVDEAKAFFALHGEPFNETGWRWIVDEHGGHLPLRIRAVPEGSVIPTHNALVTIESTDPASVWVPSYFETLLLRLWYPVTVATLSWHVKQTIRQFLEKTSDDPAGQLPFKLHDFGARGVSSAESAGLGGAAHLVNFIGTDTLSAILAAKAYYHEPMAGVPDGIRAILERITEAGFATDNIAFGMGGGLLQKVNRDTQKFALKCSAARVVGKWIDVYKQPVTDPGKDSKRGRLMLIRHHEYGTYKTIGIPAGLEDGQGMALPQGWEDAMETVWENGQLMRDWTFAQVRARSLNY